jgi:hypothetical protein
MLALPAFQSILVTALEQRPAVLESGREGKVIRPEPAASFAARPASVKLDGLQMAGQGGPTPPAALEVCRA